MRKMMVVLSLLVFLGAAMSVMAVHQDSDNELHGLKGMPPVDIRIWGQVNRAVLYAENGVYSEWFSVDNDSSPSRIGIAGDYTPDEWPGWLFGGQIELGLKSETTSTIEFNKDEREFDVDGRKIEAYMKNKRFGKLSIGQGDMASNGTAEEDLSGTYVISYSQVRFLGPGLIFGTNGPMLKDVFSNFDGLHRDDRVRYDTPSWGGLSLAVSAASGDLFDVAVRYAAELRESKLGVAFSYANKGDGVEQYSGSCSVLFGNGLNATLAAGGQDIEDEYSPLSVYAKLGWKLSLLSWGQTCVAVDYAKNEEVSMLDDCAESYAFVVNQRVDPLSSDVYMGVRSYSLDRSDEDFDDLLSFMAGVRIKF